MGADVTLKGGTYTGDTYSGCLFRIIKGDGASSKVLLENLTVSTNGAVFKTQGNLGATTHGKAVSSFVVTGDDIAGDFVMKENGTDGDASATVSGGTFDRAIAQEYCVDGFAPVRNRRLHRRQGLQGLRFRNREGQVHPRSGRRQRHRFGRPAGSDQRPRHDGCHGSRRCGDRRCNRCCGGFRHEASFAALGCKLK